MTSYYIYEDHNLTDPDGTTKVYAHLSLYGWRDPEISCRVEIPKQTTLPDDPQNLYVLKPEWKETARLLLYRLPDRILLHLPSNPAPSFTGGGFCTFISSEAPDRLLHLPNSWVRPLSEVAEPATPVVPLMTQAALPGSEHPYTVLREVGDDRLLLGTLLPAPHTRLAFKSEVVLTFPRHLKNGTRVRVDDRLKDAMLTHRLFGNNPAYDLSEVFGLEFEIKPESLRYFNGSANLKHADREGQVPFWAVRIPLAYLIPVNN